MTTAFCVSVYPFFISSVSFLMERGWGIGEDAAHWYVPSCLLFSGSSSAVPSIHSSHVLCVNIVSPLFCIFYGLVKKEQKKKNVLPYGLKLLMKKIIWLKQITELCSMVLLFKKNWFIFRLVWFVLVLPFSLAPFFLFLLFLSCEN